MSNKQDFYDQRWVKNTADAFWGYERNRKLPQFFPQIYTYKNAPRLLDLGCGDGLVSQFFAELGYAVWGIDISPAAIRQAQKRNIGTFRVGDVEKILPYRNNFFDIVFWGDAIEHLFDPQSVLGEIRRILKKPGRLVISTPNTGFILNRWHYFKTGTLPITEGHPTQLWNTGHIRFFNAAVLEKLLHMQGFSVKKIAAAAKPGLFHYFSLVNPDLFGSILLVEARL